MRSLAFLLLLLTACVTRPDIAGVAQLGDDAYEGRYTVSGHRLVLELSRAGKTLDRLETRLAKHEYTCIATTPDHFALFGEDASHAHPLVRAWRFDLGAGKIVAVDPLGLHCTALCPDEEP